MRYTGEEVTWEEAISDRRSPPPPMAPLTPDAVLETVHLTAPMGIIAVQGYAENVSKP